MYIYPAVTCPVCTIESVLSPSEKQYNLIQGLFLTDYGNISDKSLS